MIKKQIVTMALLAKRLNVSSATVAKALNGTGRISADMRVKVRELADQLGYVPNFAASSLRTKRKDTVGVLITSDIKNPWYSQLISLLESELSARGFSMILVLSKNDPGKTEAALRNFSGGRVNAIIVGPVRKADFFIADFALKYKSPIVIFNNPEPLPIPYVSLNQGHGAEIALEHLYGLGHRKIMYLGLSSSAEKEFSNTRFSVYFRFMNEKGLKTDYVELEDSVFVRRTAFQAAVNLLAERKKKDLPTALFCHNDDAALGVMSAFQQAGIRIPEDISIVGFDDISESSFCSPGLTTVGKIIDELSSRLGDVTQQIINGTLEKPGCYSIEPLLIERGSTGVPRHESQKIKRINFK